VIEVPQRGPWAEPLWGLRAKPPDAIGLIVPIKTGFCASSVYFIAETCTEIKK